MAEECLGRANSENATLTTAPAGAGSGCMSRSVSSGNYAVVARRRNCAYKRLLRFADLMTANEWELLTIGQPWMSAACGRLGADGWGAGS